MPADACNKRQTTADLPGGSAFSQYDSVFKHKGFFMQVQYILVIKPFSKQTVQGTIPILLIINKNVNFLGAVTWSPIQGNTV